jgi:hypothetical protein
MIVTEAMNQACWMNSRNWKGRRKIPRRSQRPAGEWCRENGVTPPPRSFEEKMTMSPGSVTRG